MTPWKEFDGTIYELDEGVWLPNREGRATRLKNTLSLFQISWEYPHYINKLAEIIFDPKYSLRSKEFARSVLDYLKRNQYVSWKQFDSILNVKS